jgi:hypothetical protein
MSSPITLAGSAIGTVDGDLPLTPRQHWTVASKASWFEITDPLPQFPVVPTPR